MHSKDIGIILVYRELGVNIVDVGVYSSDFWHIIDGRFRELIGLLCNDSLGIEFLENRHEAPAIPIISDSAAVVDMPWDIGHRIPGYSTLFVKKHLNDGSGSFEVWIIELVADIPAERSKFTTLLDNGMEVGKAPD